MNYSHISVYEKQMLPSWLIQASLAGRSVAATTRYLKLVAVTTGSGSCFHKIVFLNTVIRGKYANEYLRTSS